MVSIADRRLLLRCIQRRQLFAPSSSQRLSCEGRVQVDEIDPDALAARPHSNMRPIVRWQTETHKYSMIDK